MRTAFCLFKYFPYGGLQRDFLDIATMRREAGDDVFVYTRSWQGDRPDGMVIREIDSKAIANHTKYRRYHAQVEYFIAADQIDCVVGFNKMPGLDIYFASDPCYKARQQNWVQKLSPRYRHFLAYEGAVFDQSSASKILILAERQQQEYQQAWATPDSRFECMPPGISKSACAGKEKARYRQTIRAELGVHDDEFLLLMIGSGFRTKGLDRALAAMQALPDWMKHKTRLFVIGQDKAAPFKKLAEKMGLAAQVEIMPGRSDIPQVMQAGDMLLHPAYREVAGKVILEAIVAGLPVIVSEVCGYAHHVQRADAGVVMQEPFDQNTLNQALLSALESDKRMDWQQHGIAYGQTENLYSMASAASEAIGRHGGRVRGTSL